MAAFPSEPEPLDPEWDDETLPNGWTDPLPDDWDEAWEPHEWLDLDSLDDDGSAEAGRYRRVRTIDVRSELL